MWEAKADGDVDDLIAWWHRAVTPQLPKDVTVEMFRSAERLVALLRPVERGFRLPDPPAGLIARPPHAWPFEAV